MSKLFFVCRFDFLNDMQNIMIPEAVFSTFADCEEFLIRSNDYADLEILEIETDIEDSVSNIPELKNESKFFVCYKEILTNGFEFKPVFVSCDEQKIHEYRDRQVGTYLIEIVRNLKQKIDRSSPILCKKGYSYRIDMNTGHYWTFEGLEYLDKNNFDQLRHHCGTYWNIYIDIDQNQHKLHLEDLIQRHRLSQN
ncbi:MAG: hypothetical protein ACRCXZ_01830 [Patescibacteria group bacterium]